jgi:hypothetical protein
MVAISEDVGGVADELARIDPGLKVRFAENGDPPYWVVFHESVDAEGRQTHHLVLTQQAYQSPLGIWEGLDHRIVERIREIDPHGRGGYDYARELQKQNERVEERRREAFREKVGPLAEQAAHALRKDLGSTARAFIPRDVLA